MCELASWQVPMYLRAAVKGFESHIGSPSAVILRSHLQKIRLCSQQVLSRWAKAHELHNIKFALASVVTGLTAFHMHVT